MTTRLDTLRQKMVSRRLDAILISQPQNIRYLSGFTGGADGALFITPRLAYILTDFRYLGMVQEQCPRFTLKETSVTLPLDKAVLGLVQETGAARVGFEGHHLTYDTYRGLRKALLVAGHAAARLVPVPKLVDEIRAVKEPAELAIMERAVLLGDAAFAHVYQALTAPGAATHPAFINSRSLEPASPPVWLLMRADCRWTPKSKPATRPDRPRQ